MSRRARIGELLSRLVPLSGHDVEEILEEQSSNHRRFGEIALSWGLCQPEHVWDAWCQQSADGGEPVDLDQIGVDAQAAALLPAETARTLGCIPVRAANDVILVATSDTTPEQSLSSLAGLLHRRVRFVHSDGEQLRRVIDIYYPPSTAA